MTRSWTELAINQKWASGAGFLSRSTGGGSVSVSGSILTTTASLGDTACKDFFVPVKPGQRVEMDVWGRWISGTAGLWLNAYNWNSTSGSQREKLLLKQIADWMLYRIGYTMPQQADSQFVRLTVGVNDTTAAGSAQFKRPIIRTAGGFGTSLVLAQGLIKLQPTVPSVVLHPNFRSFGVASVAYDGSGTVTVTLDRDIINSPSAVSPHVLISGTPDHPFVPVAGQVAPGSPGTFFVKWSNGTAIQDVHTVTALYAFFQVVL